MHPDRFPAALWLALLLAAPAAARPAAPQPPAPPGAEPPPARSHQEMEAREDPAAMLEFRGEEAPSLERLLELARERSPRLEELRARAAAAQERVAPAAALADPTLETRLVNEGVEEWRVGSDPNSMVEVGVRQELPWPGKRGARRGEAEAAAAAAEVELVAAERELERDVTASYGRLHAFDQEVRLLDEAHELLDLLTATVASRYSVGAADQEALVKVGLMQSRHDVRREEVLRERDEMAARLRGLLALPAGTPIRQVPRLEPLALPPADLAALAATVAPAVVARQARTLEAERRVAVARLALRPDFSVSGAAGLRGALDPMVSLGFGVELPFWRRSRQLPLLRAAEQELAAARAAEHDASNTASADAEGLLASWRRLARQIELYDQGVLPQTSAALEAARSAFVAARGDFSAVIEDYTLWLEARTERARLDGERFALRAEMTALVGPDPSPVVEGARP